jgi:hypothetical protein
MLKPIFLVIVSACIFTDLSAQKALFLHHSTGGGVYFEGNVSGWISDYNSANKANYEVTERAYPDSPYPWENYPYDFWKLWVNPATSCNNNQPGVECIGSLTAKYNVIIFKHCFPGAGIDPDGATSSVSSSSKTLGNYKLQYRAIREMMDKYPANKFIVWTLAPLHRNATSADDAARAKQFVDWVKNDWLKEDGKNHPNIFVFDFWGIVAESNQTPLKGAVNCLKYDYEGSHTGNDSHPNTAANKAAGPLFAEFIVNTLEFQTGVEKMQVQADFCTVTTKPGKLVTIELETENLINACFSLFVLNGQLVFKTSLKSASQTFGQQKLSPGIYCYSVSAGNKFSNGKLVIND